MRVTNSMMVNTMMKNMGKNLGRMDKIQQQLATGKKFIYPSDDPIGVSRSLRINTDISQMTQFKRNVEDAQSWLEATETAVTNMISILQRARELTVQGANETYSLNEREKIAVEIGQLRDQLISLGNTTYAGSYIFSGFKTNKPLLKSDGTYDLGGGNISENESIEFNSGIGDRIQINFVGQRLFGLSDTASDLDENTADSLKSRQVLESSPIAVPALGVGGKSFNINYNGTDYSISLPAVPADYPDINSLASAIQTAIDSTALNGVITVTGQDRRLIFNSYSSSSPDNSMKVTSGVPDLLSSVGLTSGQSSKSEVRQGDSPLLIKVFDQLVADLNSGNTSEIQKAISRLDIHLGNMNDIRAEIGVKTNRLELTDNRIQDDILNLNRLLSKNEDADMAEVIMRLKNEENVYRASLSGGARIIQPSLVDFLR